MNISKQLKNYRKELNISQEELAQVVHVSRQTISNWENDKSYPDVQSLVLLSEYFKTSLDELVKGDIVEMKSKLEKNRMNKYAIGMLIGWGLMLVSLALAKFSLYILIVTAASLVVMVWSAFKVEKIKKEKNIYTYQDIVTYMETGENNIKGSKRRNSFMTKMLYFIGSGALTALVLYLLITYI